MPDLAPQLEPYRDYFAPEAMPLKEANMELTYLTAEYMKDGIDITQMMNMWFRGELELTPQDQQVGEFYMECCKADMVTEDYRELLNAVLQDHPDIKVVYDIGANDGLGDMVFADAGIDVIAIDPSQRNYNAVNNPKIHHVEANLYDIQHNIPEDAVMISASCVGTLIPTRDLQRECYFTSGIASVQHYDQRHTEVELREGGYVAQTGNAMQPESTSFREIQSSLRSLYEAQKEVYGVEQMGPSHVEMTQESMRMTMTMK